MSGTKYITEFQKKPLNDRQSESFKIRSKYRDRVPVIVDTLSSSELTLDKNKYLVPNDLTVGQFVYVIRKRCKLAPEKALFVFVNNKIPLLSDLVSNIYKNEKNEDGYLYIIVNDETTFGFHTNL